MARTINSRRGKKSGFDAGFKKLREFAIWTGNARSEPVQESSKVLVKAIKKRLSKRAPGATTETVTTESGRKRRRLKKYGASSAPGASPHKQTGSLQKSIRRGVVDGAMRVGSNDFTAVILNDGAMLPARKARASGAEKFVPTSGARKGKLTSKRARKAYQGISIAPRPFMEPGLEDAKKDMTVKTTSSIQKKMRKITNG